MAHCLEPLLGLDLVLSYSRSAVPAAMCLHRDHSERDMWPSGSWVQVWRCVCVTRWTAVTLHMLLTLAQCLHESASRAARTALVFFFWWRLSGLFKVWSRSSAYELSTLWLSYPTRPLLLLEVGGPQSFVHPAEYFSRALRKKNSVGVDHLLPQNASWFALGLQKGSLSHKALMSPSGLDFNISCCGLCVALIPKSCTL